MIELLQVASLMQYCDSVLGHSKSRFHFCFLSTDHLVGRESQPQHAGSSSHAVKQGSVRALASHDRLRLIWSHGPQARASISYKNQNPQLQELQISYH